MVSSEPALIFPVCRILMLPVGINKGVRCLILGKIIKDSYLSEIYRSKKPPIIYHNFIAFVNTFLVDNLVQNRYSYHIGEAQDQKLRGVIIT